MKILKAGFLAAGILGSLSAQQTGVLSPPTTNLGVSDTLYNISISVLPSAQQGPYLATEMIQKHGPLVEDENAATASVTAAMSNPAVQNGSPRAQFAAVAGANFEGPGTGYAGFQMTGAPPDTTLAVGPNHIVAWVNSQYTVFNKSGTILLGGTGFLNGSSLFTGTGSLCESTNRGDPVLQYDRMADRFILSQFAFNVSGSGSPIAPYLQCFAVSTSNNPLGSYFRYAVQFSATSPEGFNDYAKLGVWPDGYYTSYNVFGGSPAGANTGATLCASDRAAMLVGAAATTVCSGAAFYAGGAAFLPGDMDGTTLPVTLAQGNIFMRQSTAPALRMIKVKPDYATPGNSTFSDGLGGAFGSFVSLPLGPTVRACNNGNPTCVAQPGTATKLDTLSDRLMYRLAYRNRGGVDSLVVVQSVDPDGAGARSSAVRWYEVRSPFSATPSLFQNATYDPGASGDRWMGSIAMDKLGNMAMGYSLVNAGTGLKPSIAISGRLRTDLRNQMQAEQIIFTGTGSQTTYGNLTPLTRWGDYTTMQVDPSNDCTFWYIGQYLSSDGAFNWRTRIASFKFNGCN